MTLFFCRKYLDYLFCNEKSRENKKTKSEQRRIEWQANMVAKTQTEDTNEMKYGLSHNTLFLRIYQQNMNQFYHARLISSAMFEPKLVFDCSYQDYMTRIENHNCAKQLTLAFAANRIHDNPMFLHFCNLKEGILRQNFLRNMPNLLDEDFPAIVTSQSYLDLFPKDQLIYLTPHCKTDLLEYDSDMVYIIGAMVDKVSYYLDKLYIVNLSYLLYLFNNFIAYSRIQSLYLWQKPSKKVFVWQNYL